MHNNNNSATVARARNISDVQEEDLYGDGTQKNDLSL
jgi:hypothetical protein